MVACLIKSACCPGIYGGVVLPIIFCIQIEPAPFILDTRLVATTGFRLVPPQANRCSEARYCQCQRQNAAAVCQVPHEQGPCGPPNNAGGQGMKHGKRVGRPRALRLSWIVAASRQATRDKRAFAAGAGSGVPIFPVVECSCGAQ